ncbi:MAG: ABC transporter permease [Egibacteraceae bacterium]
MSEDRDGRRDDQRDGRRTGRRDGSGLRDFVEGYFRAAPVLVPVYAVLTACVVGSVVILLAGRNPLVAYEALFAGAFGSPRAVATTLARSTPYIVASLAVAFGFKAGLFNIGAEGQLLVGALVGAWVGAAATVAGLPAIVAIPLVLLAGVVGGLLWGGIPGVLKARTGAHEVIVTIMLNNVALRMAEWLIASTQPLLLRDPQASQAVTRPIAGSARLPALAGTPLDLGFVVALALCALVWFVLQRTTFGFEIRTVGVNPHAARYAGMSVERTVVGVMAASGALAGIAGSAALAGSGSGAITAGSFANIGFDSIAIALLARANPYAVVPAAVLWAGLLVGAPNMQLQAGVSGDLVRIVQALIIVFVAADAIVRYLFRIRRPRAAEDVTEEAIFAKGWGV